MSQSSPPYQPKRRTTIFARLLNWPLVRKLESLAFLAMFLAMPLFAFRVVEYTSRQLALQNAAHDLARDIRRARGMAMEKQLDVTVEAKRGQPQLQIFPSYVIKHEDSEFESVILPKGVFMIGKITFQPDGVPQSKATFEVHNETRSLLVDVDAQGVVSQQ